MPKDRSRNEKHIVNVGMVCEIATIGLVRLTNFGWTVVVVRDTHMCRT